MRALSVQLRRSCEGDGLEKEILTFHLREEMWETDIYTLRYGTVAVETVYLFMLRQRY